MGTLMLALEMVVVPDQRLEFLSAGARDSRHRPRFARATAPIIGTDAAPSLRFSTQWPDPVDFLAPIAAGAGPLEGRGCCQRLP